MTPEAILALLAAQLPELSSATPDLPRLRALCAFAQSALHAIEIVDLEARIHRLENPR